MSNFFEELKKRNVYKAATAYAVTSWLVIQVVNTIGPNLSWPNSIAALVTKILLVGFPVALILTWLYEFTPKGLKRTGKVQQDTSDNRRTGRRLNRVIITSLTLVICVLLADRLFSGNTSINQKQQASIAVLPFDYLSLLKDKELLEDEKLLASAIPAQILNELGQISGMFVPAKTSCWMYKDKQESIKVIAKELEVNYVLEGSVQLVGRGRRIKVSTRLINGNNGIALWFDNFEEDLDELENIQENIGRKVASKLKVQLLPSEDMALASKLSQDPEAYRLYIKAKASEDVDIAVDFLNKALELDPEFAEAHAELSRLYPEQFFSSNLPKAERDAKVNYHLEKALEYGPEKAEVLIAKASHKLYKKPNDSSEVISDLRKVIKMNPNSAEAYFILAHALGWAGQQNFIKYAEKAWELDRFKYQYAQPLANYYYNQKKEYDKAFDILNRIIQKDSVSQALRQKGRFLASAPYGELAQFYILTHEAGKKDPNELFNLNYRLLNSLDLDLVPIAEKYGRLIQMGYPDNEDHTYDNLSALYMFKGEYDKWLEMVEFWSANKGLNKDTEAIDRGYIQMGTGNIKIARKIVEIAFPDLGNMNIPADSISYFRNNYDQLVLYAEILRMDRDTENSDSLANLLCEYYKLGPGKNERAPLRIKNDRLLDCYYLSNDTTSFVMALEDRYFRQNDRLGVFISINQGYYSRFENHKDVKALYKRITNETHRIRAQVIAYLKEEGDWNEAWDKELGLE